MPVEKTTESRLTGGTVNGAGAIVMRAERVGADTMLARIVRTMGEAQRSRAPIQPWPTASLPCSCLRSWSPRSLRSWYG
jgi:cation transport ATPase